MMPEWLQILYTCYLGKTKGRRLGAIVNFVKEHEGMKFFEEYSTSTDSILDFLKKVEARGYKL